MAAILDNWENQLMVTLVIAARHDKAAAIKFYTEMIPLLSDKANTIAKYLLDIGGRRHLQYRTTIPFIREAEKQIRESQLFIAAHESES